MNWRDVVTDAEHKPAPCKRFVNLVLDADIVAAAMKFFGMKATDDEPTKHVINDLLKTSIKAVRQRYFYRVIKEFIATFIRYPCRFPGCSSSYKHDGVNRRRHEMSHDPPPTITEIPAMINTAPDGNDPTLEDDIFNYHCGFMNMAFFLRNFMDATKEGDGERIIRVIKIFLLHFK